jgi:hypothetical protein
MKPIVAIVCTVLLLFLQACSSDKQGSSQGKTGLSSDHQTYSFLHGELSRQNSTGESLQHSQASSAIPTPGESTPQNLIQIQPDFTDHEMRPMTKAKLMSTVGAKHIKAMAADVLYEEAKKYFVGNDFWDEVCPGPTNSFVISLTGASLPTEALHPADIDHEPYLQLEAEWAKLPEAASLEAAANIKNKLLGELTGHKEEF